MSEVSPWSVIQSIAERRIEESMAKGDFDDLPGRGKPLELEDDSHVPPELRMAYKVLRIAGCVPPELAERKEISNLADMLEHCEDEQERVRQMQKLRFQFVFGCKAVIKEICGFERRQCRRAVIDQILFHEKPVSFPMLISYFTLLTAAKTQGDKTQRFTRFSLRRKRRMVVGMKTLRRLQKPIGDSVTNL